jgi:hypothetical protein
MEPSGCGVRWSVYLGVSIGHWEEFGVENLQLESIASSATHFPDKVLGENLDEAIRC